MCIYIFYIFDNTAAQEDLGFHYAISWVEGVKRVMKWIDENRKGYVAPDAALDDEIISAWQQGETVAVAAMPKPQGS